MEKKKQPKSLKPMTCEKGCDVTKTICAHIEKTLPQLNNRTLFYGIEKTFMQDSIQGMSTDEFETRSRSLENKLYKIGLEQFRVTLLVDRFVSKLSLKEIAIRNGYTSPGVVLHLIDRTLETLRKFDEKFITELLSGEFDSAK